MGENPDHADREGNRRDMNSKQKGKRGELEWAKFCRKNYGLKDSRRGQQHSGIEIKQALEDAKPGEVAYVAHRRNYEDWLITVRACDLHGLVEIIHFHEFYSGQ